MAGRFAVGREDEEALALADCVRNTVVRMACSD